MRKYGVAPKALTLNMTVALTRVEINNLILNVLDYPLFIVDNNIPLSPILNFFIV